MWLEPEEIDRLQAYSGPELAGVARQPDFELPSVGRESLPGITVTKLNCGIASGDEQAARFHFCVRQHGGQIYGSFPHRNPNKNVGGFDNDSEDARMNASIPLKDACAMQTLLSKNRLAGPCVSAGHLVIVEINAPAETPPEQLAQLLKVGNSTVTDSVLKCFLSCVRRYPDKSLKMDLHFHSREDASTFLEIARTGR